MKFECCAEVNGALVRGNILKLNRKMEKWRQKLQVKFMTHSQRKFCSTGEVDRFKTLN